MTKSFFARFAIIVLLGVCIACKKKTAMPAPDPGKPRAEKTVYIPKDWKNIDLNNNNSEWSYERSVKSANIILFWQKGFGADPSKTTDQIMRFDKDVVLKKAERIYDYYRNVLRFTGTATRTDSVRMMIHVIYSKDWVAAGSGWDDIIGALWVTPTALNIDDVVAHEIGHCFQYQVACDGMYGFRDQNYVGSFWEQCAQYMARQLYPATNLDDLKFFTGNAYRNFSNEEIRYQSFHLQEYWKMKHGADFIGNLWRGAIKPEHPLETYRRITGIDQAGLNDELADYAMHCVNWDFPDSVYERAAAIRTNAYFTTKLNKNANDDTYMVDTAFAPECYGFNVIELNLLTGTGQVSVNFHGLDNARFKALQGWRYGFVSMDIGNKPTYGAIGRAESGTLTYIIPQGTVKLWFLVTGAPMDHYNHVWGTAQNDIPKFSYKLTFKNTLPKM